MLIFLLCFQVMMMISKGKIEEVDKFCEDVDRYRDWLMNIVMKFTLWIYFQLWYW